MPCDIIDQMKALERDKRELRQTNEIFNKASAYFAMAKLDRALKRCSRSSSHRHRPSSSAPQTTTASRPGCTSWSHSCYSGIGYRLDAVTGTVRLLPDNRARQRAQLKPVDWHPARRGADVAEVFTEVAQEFRTGDRMQFTRNNYRADRLNGQTAEVVAIDAQGASMVLEREDGRRKMLDLRHLADRHVRPGWVRTIHSAQGTAAERVIAHLEAFRANAVDARSVYGAISRARHGAALYTDSRADLTDALGIRDGAQVGAIVGHDATRRHNGAGMAAFAM